MLRSISFQGKFQPPLSTGFNFKIYKTYYWSCLHPALILVLGSALVLVLVLVLQFRKQGSSLAQAGPSSGPGPKNPSPCSRKKKVEEFLIHMLHMYELFWSLVIESRQKNYSKLTEKCNLSLLLNCASLYTDNKIKNIRSTLIIFLETNVFRML